MGSTGPTEPPAQGRQPAHDRELSHHPGPPQHQADQTGTRDAPSREGGKHRRTWWFALGAGVVVVALVGLWAIRRDPGGPTLTIRLIAATDPGPAPFTDDASSTVEADVEVIRTVGADLLEPQTGAEGLVVRPLTADTGAPAYGTAETPPCDVDAIAASLDADPDARAAWADLMGIEPSEARATLATLTPLVLAHDTAVTNSRYVDETPSTFQAILQAGTAVLVDGTGTPRVKCSCGNPLLPPEVIGDAALEGDQWDDFDKAAIVTIGATRQGTPMLDTIDATTGDIVSVELATEEPSTEDADAGGERSIRDRDPVPDDCMVRYVDMYRTAEDMGTGWDDLAWSVPWDEVPGSTLDRASTHPDVTVLLRDADGLLQRADLGRLEGALGSGDDLGPFILCGGYSEGIYWVEQEPLSDLPDDGDRVTLEGLGALRIDASYEQAEVATGHPMQRHYPMLGEDESCVIASFGNGGDDGITVLGGEGRIRRISIDRPSAVRTSTGVGIGSSEDEVRAAYPGGIEVEPHAYDPGWHYLIHQSTDVPDRMIIFETDGSNVTSFRVGDGEFTPLVEGCA